eukprot:scaffold830_cov377-Prasinococcus_capsulatus_cf.AAC.12
MWVHCLAGSLSRCRARALIIDSRHVTPTTAQAPLWEGRNSSIAPSSNDPCGAATVFCRRMAATGASLVLIYGLPACPFGTFG